MRHSGRAKELKLAIQRTLSGSNDERAGRTFAKNFKGGRLASSLLTVKLTRNVRAAEMHEKPVENTALKQNS